MRKAIAGGLAVLALTAAAPAQADASGWPRCGSWDGSGAWGYKTGSGFGYFNVQAHNVSCRKARQVVRAQRFWEYDTGYSFGSVQWGEGHLYRWNCEVRSAGWEASRHLCMAAGRKRVKFVSAA